MSATSIIAPPSTKYFPAIDSLRAIAAIMVVLEHSGAFLFIRGWKEKSILGGANLGFGVDLFFVISGFVVFSSIIPSLYALEKDFFQFWLRFLMRRFFRLAPVCFFWLFIVLLLSRKLPYPYFIDYKSTRHEVIGIISYLYNYMAAFKFYLIKDAPLNLGYHHSLSTEEQFYFLLPLLLFWLREKWIAIFCISIICLSFIIQRPMTWYYFRYDSFLYGILLAQVFNKYAIHTFNIPEFRKTFLLKIVGPILLWLGIWALVHIHYYTIHQRIFETAALMSVFILVLACVGVRPLINNKIDSCLAYIGKRSYTLYLTHMPTFMILNALLIKFHWTVSDGSKMRVSFNTVESVLIILTAVSILWLFVELSYRYIELPARSAGKKLSSNFSYSYVITTVRNKTYQLILFSKRFIFRSPHMQNKLT